MIDRSTRPLVCIDANLVIPLLTGEASDAHRDRWRHWRSHSFRMIAPVLLRYEALNGIYRTSRAAQIPAETMRAATASILDLPIEMVDDPELHRRALEFAIRFDLPATYDAHYLALADQHGCELWTNDRRLHAAVTPDLPWIHIADD